MAQKFPPIGMSPAVWGPIFWTTMHIVSLGYSTNPTEEEKHAAAAFYNSLAHTIPCPICRSHYKMFLKQMPVENAVGSRDDLIHWVYTIHNKVNVQLGKPELSFEKYISTMQRLSEKEHVRITETALPFTSAMMVLGLGAIVGVTGYYFYNKYK